jgi:hypothetical protein
MLTMNYPNRFVFCVLAIFAFPAGVLATETLSIPHVHHPPVLADFVKVQADPGAHAAGMRVVDRLVQRVPQDGAPVSERTKVYIGYDGENLYAAFVCFDETPSAVRGQLAGRERIQDDDDAVAMQLDTFGDRKNAYTFQVSAAGVQRDGIWSESSGAWDFAFDAIWQAESARTPLGYVVLITVPFNSLRFPPRDEQSWGLFFLREIPRKGELAFWPAYSTRVAGRLTQAAAATGIRGVTAPRSVQLTPYTTTHAIRGAHQENGLHRPEVGIDGKWILRNSYVVDAAINPDFSQIESDEPQVTVNERFEKLFPEKRLFFLENASFFRTPIPLLFTRRVADPSVGVRVTGRQGPYSVAALVVDDESAGAADEDRRASLVVARGTRNVGRDGSIGTFVSTHQQDGHANTLAAVDGRFAIGAQWTGTWQAAASTSQARGRLASAGPAYAASLKRAGRLLTYAADWHDRGEGFRADAGFVPRTNFRSLAQSLSYRFRSSDGPLVAWGPDLASAYAWTRDGLRLDAALTPRLTFEWTGPTLLTLSRTLARERLRPGETRAVLEPLDTVADRSGVELVFNRFQRVVGSASISRGDGINLRPIPGETPAPGDASEITGSLSARVTSGLMIDATYLARSLTDARLSADVLANRIVRLKSTYQLTRELGVRLIVQHDSLLIDERLTPLRPYGEVTADFLVTYLVAPGRALYIGINRFERDDRLWSEAPPRERRWQFFTKLSYTFLM